jgi:acyl carrier protein
MNLSHRLQEMIAATLHVPPSRITESTIAEDLPSWDSLGQVNLMMALEQTFGVYIEVEDFDRLKSIPAILNYLKASGVE